MCVCSGSCIYTFMCTQMSLCLRECNLKIFYGQNKEKHDGNPFLAMLAACGSVCSLLWVRLKNLDNYLVDRHKNIQLETEYWHCMSLQITDMLKLWDCSDLVVLLHEGKLDKLCEWLH